jgi:hypothetical protein
MRVVQGSALLVLLALVAACDPLGPMSGGRLDGRSSPSRPTDWSFTDAYDTIQLEVRPAKPYSVNVWCVTTGGGLYVAAGETAESSVWARALFEDPHARLRIDGVLYDVIATRVVGEEEIMRYVDALTKKYPISDATLSNFESRDDVPAGAVLFRMDTLP